MVDTDQVGKIGQHIEKAIASSPSSILSTLHMALSFFPKSIQVQVEISTEIFHHQFKRQYMLQRWNLISKLTKNFQRKICFLVVLRSISLNYSSQLYQVVTYRWCGKKSQMATFVGILFTPGQFRNILVHKFPWFFGKFPNVVGGYTVRVKIIAAWMKSNPSSLK